MTQDFDKTTRITPHRSPSGQAGQLLTIFDADKPPYSIRLSDMNKPVITFGRDAGNDIVLTSHIVSRLHGKFFFSGGQLIVEDCGSKNGILYNDANISTRVISNGDFLRIDDGIETIAKGVLFVFSEDSATNQWHTFPIQNEREITIGRDPSCTIVLSHVGVSKCHAKITRESDGFYLADTGSTNGLTVNERPIHGKVKLHEKDIITITNSKLIFTSAALSYCTYKKGISVDASDIVIRRGKEKKSFVTCNHTSVSVKPGELVAIVGGSGAGKSTLLNCLCGYLKPASGSVYINGVNLYQNFDAMKQIIGYVPQSDIVYDNLTLYDMLLYTTKLRLPKDTTDAERKAAIQRAIHMVELDEKAHSMIRALSGGQRKRASIAVELLSDPSLLFLDEPASGLDPGTERSLMHSLRQMADAGKTVILVTHSTLQLKLCDKIVFMGKGGNLCYFGAHDNALSFFVVTDVVDIYALITEKAPFWRDRYQQVSGSPVKVPPAVQPGRRTRKNRVRQLGVLCARYAKLVSNDRQRLLLLLCQAPILALLISFVANDQQFEQYEMTKSLLFALSCSAFWIGMLNAIQEVCKERIILKREYMTGLSLSSYLLSKITVLGVLCLVQSVLVTGVFAGLVGLPENGLFLPPYPELLITTFLTAIASAGMGLFVSCLFTNADRAMTVAPILLMPQILFSGLIFKLDGVTESISWFALCRWSMEGYGSTANLNELPLKLQQEGMPLEHEAETFFEFTKEHLLTDWGILLLFLVISLILARIVLSKIGRDEW